MKKYQTEFKLKLVSSYLAGDCRAKLLARQWALPESTVRYLGIELLDHLLARRAIDKSEARR